MSPVGCPCTTWPRAHAAPARYPCLEAVFAGDDPTVWTDEWYHAGHYPSFLWLRCRSSGLVWLVDAWDDRGLAWDYTLVPESWPRARASMLAGTLDFQVIPAAYDAAKVGRLDLAETLILEASEGRWPADARALRSVMDDFDRRPAHERESAPRVRDLFEGDEAARVAAARWLGDTHGGLRSEFLGCARWALLGALADPSPSVSGLAARGLAPSAYVGSFNRLEELLYAHHTAGLPCQCLALPRRTRPPEAYPCLVERPPAHRPAARQLPRGATPAPVRLGCRHTGLDWLAYKWRPDSEWYQLLAPASWAALAAAARRAPLTSAAYVALAVRVRDAGQAPVAWQLLDEGLAPGGLITVAEDRNAAEALRRQPDPRAPSPDADRFIERALHGTADERRAAVVSLEAAARAGSPVEAIAVLMAAVHDEDAPVAEAASLILDRSCAGAWHG